MALEGCPVPAVFAVVITSWPHRAEVTVVPFGPPYVACCCTGHAKCGLLPILLGTVATILVSDQEVMLRGTVAVPDWPFGRLTNTADPDPCVLPNP
jgi:hypothetical protein